MNIIVKKFISMVCILSLVGCAATHTAISKRNLDVQTKMSASIFLEPVEVEKQTVYVQVKNTSDKPELNLTQEVKNVVMARGYQVVSSPKKANYLLQANILQVGKADLRETESALTRGFGGALSGVVTGAAVGDMIGNRDSTLGFGLLGGIAGTVTDAMVKDITYSIVTDIQISERAENGVIVEEELNSKLSQGTNSKRKIKSTEKHNWKRYQTRIISTANKVNLKFEAALPELIKGLTNSISGIMA
jgi:hypothetical protein